MDNPLLVLMTAILQSGNDHGLLMYESGDGRKVALWCGIGDGAEIVEKSHDLVKGDNR